MFVLNKIYKITFIILLFITKQACLAQSYNVSTLAGNGSQGYINGTFATSEMYWPYGLAYDGDSIVYFADSYNHLIRKISYNTNLVSTIAGSGTPGLLDGVGTAAKFNNPDDVFYKNGFLYIGDNTNNCIRKIDLSNNMVTTLAGTGVAGYLDGPASTAQFQGGNGIALAIANNGDIFVADGSNAVVRLISGGQVTTVAGTPGVYGYTDGPALSAKFHRPRYLALDTTNGDLYITDINNNVIRKLSGGMVTTFSGTGVAGGADGPANTATFSAPVGIARTDAGYFYVVDGGGNKIRILDPSGTVTTLAGNGVFGFQNGNGPNAEFYYPQDICFDKHCYIYIADRNNNRIRKMLAPSGLTNFSLVNPSCSLNGAFTNLSTNASAYTWSFGDGGTSSLANPSYTYTSSGQYTVSLIANPGSSCADTSMHVVNIGVGSSTAQFSTSQANCNKTISITNNSANTTNNSWNLGDGTHTNTLNPFTHLYPAAGTYTITLITDTNSACSDTLKKIITIPSPPTSNFSATTASCSMNSTFLNSSVGATTYTWLFGDGNTSQLSNPVYSYLAAGQYTVSLVASSAIGCNDTSQQIININSVPQAQFTFTTNNCNSSIAITNTSTNASVFGWDFGDGNQSTSISPNHIYSSSGTYSVTLVASSLGGCTDTLEKTVILQNPKPLSVFTTSATVCVGNSSFVNNSINAQAYNWNFGDGSSISTAFSPTHSYTLAGTYTAQLIAINQTCSKYDTSYQTINVLSTPIVHLGNDTSICTGGGVAFDLNAGNAGASYNWSNGLTTQTIPVSSPGSYWVQVTVAGCSSGDTINIFSPHFTLGNDSMFCGKENIEIKPKNLNIIPNKYLWSTGDNTPTLLVTEEGMYWLQISEGNCIVRDTINVIGGNESSLLWVPNTFTPNEDGLNEIFKPTGTDIIQFDMKIFNRWGEKIFESNDFNVGWNGTYKGQTAETATYVWLINYTTSCSKNTNIRKSGQVNVIR